jgi:PAS domain-containing protein
MIDVKARGLLEAVRHVPAAVGVVDASGRTLFANERLQDLIENRIGRTMPANLDDPVPISHVEDGRVYTREEWPASRTFDTGNQVVDEEFFYFLPGWGRLYVCCSTAPVHDEEGRASSRSFS